jgi:restriction system protein
MSYSSYSSIVARQAREAERAHRAHLRAIEQSRRAADRAAKQADKTRRMQHLERQQSLAEEKTQETEARCEQLGQLLTLRPVSGSPFDGLNSTPAKAVARVFGALRKVHSAPPFSPAEAAGMEPNPPRPEDFAPRLPQRPGFFSRVFAQGEEKYQAELARVRAAASTRLHEATTAFALAHAAWNERVVAGRKAFDENQQEISTQVDEHNLHLDEWKSALLKGDPASVIEYVSTLLDLACYPDEIDVSARVAFSAESKSLVVEVVLPELAIVPATREFTYVRAKDEIKEKPRAKGEITSTYRTLVASLSLRIIRDLFAGTPEDVVAAVTLNGMLETIDLATGDDIRPCVISVRVTREQFSPLNLERVEPVTCLGQLGASVSKKPEEQAPVRPVIEFDMVDKRFVTSEDVIDAIDQRQNIMELTPFEFEQLVTNLFGKMGLDAKQTRSSRDGGVDCVAFDPRPVLGGKVVIQAKRYRHTVGVSAVRDLFGTMMNEGANKGILVTTAGYGPDAFTFAKDKPIELIDGGNLLYLLAQQGVDARIVMPQDIAEH